MTRRAWLGLLVVLALAGLVGRQYWPVPAGGPVPVTMAPAAAPAPGLNPLAGRVAGALAGLAAHPLFAPDRTPPAALAPEPVQLEVVQPLEVVPPAPEPERVPLLQGVVVTPAPGGAYVSDGLGSDSVFLRPGQSAFGLTLEEVFADRATFMTGVGEVTLMLPESESP